MRYLTMRNMTAYLHNQYLVVNLLIYEPWKLMGPV